MLFVVWIGIIILSISYVSVFIHPYPAQDLGVGLTSGAIILLLVLILIFSWLLKFPVVNNKSDYIWKIILGVVITIISLFLFLQLAKIYASNVLFGKSEEIQLDIPKSNIDIEGLERKPLR